MFSYTCMSLNYTEEMYIYVPISSLSGTLYLVFMSLGPESINCHNHPNTFFKSPVPDTEKKKKRIIILSVFTDLILISILEITDQDPL